MWNLKIGIGNVAGCRLQVAGCRLLHSLKCDLEQGVSLISPLINNIYRLLLSASAFFRSANASVNADLRKTLRQLYRSVNPTPDAGRYKGRQEALVFMNPEPWGIRIHLLCRSKRKGAGKNFFCGIFVFLSVLKVFHVVIPIQLSVQHIHAWSVSIDSSVD